MNAGRMVIDVDANFSGIEQGLRKLRTSIDRTLSATPQQKQASAALGRVEGAARGVTARGNKTGDTQAAARAQAQLLGLQAAIGKQAKLPGFDGTKGGALTSKGQLSGSWIKNQMAPVFANMGSVGDSLRQSLERQFVQQARSTYNAQKGKSIQQIGEASTGIANKAGVFGGGAAVMADSRSAIALESARTQQLTQIGHQLTAGKQAVVGQRAFAAHVQRLNRETGQAAAATDLYEKSLRRASSNLATQKTTVPKGATVAGAAGGGGRAGRVGGAAAGAGGVGGPAVGGFPINFGRGLASTISYGAPAAALYGLIGAMREGFTTAQELQIEFGIIDDQLIALGLDGTGAFESITGEVLKTAAATGASVTEFAALQRQLVGALSAVPADNALSVRDDQGNLDADLLAQRTTEFSTAGAQLAQVVGLPVTEITDGLTAASIAFKRSFDDIGDTVVTLANRTGVLGKELVSFIGDIAPTAAEAGFELEQIATLAAQVQLASGRSGTTLAEQFNRILPSVSQAKEELIALAAENDGLNNAEFFTAIKQGDVATQLEQIANNFERMDKAARDDVIALLGGRREAGALIPALANADQRADLMEALGDSDGALQARFDEVAKSLGNTIDRIVETLKGLFYEIYSAGLADAITSVAVQFEKVAKIVGQLLGMFKEINELTGGLLGQAIAFGAAMKVAAKATAAIKAMNLFGGGAAAAQGGLSVAGGGLVNRLAQKGGYGALPVGYDVAGAFTTVQGGGKVAGAGKVASAGSKLKAAGAGLVATVGAGGIAAGAGLAAGAIAFAKTQQYMNDWQDDITEMIDEAKEAGESSEALLGQAEDLEDGTIVGNDPGYWARVGAFITGKDLVTKAEALRTAAIQQNSDEVNAIIDAGLVNEGDFEENLPKVGSYYSTVAAGAAADRADEEGLTGQARIEAIGRDVNRSGVALNTGSASVEDGGFGDIEEHIAKAEELEEVFGVGISELTPEIVEALNSKGEVYQKLLELRENVNLDPETAAQVEAALIAGFGDLTSAETAATDLEFTEIAGNIDLVNERFNAGLIGYVEYFNARQEELDKLRAAYETAEAAGAVTPEQEIQLAEAEQSFREDYSASIVTRLEALLNAANRNQQTDAAGLTAQIEQVRAAIANNQSNLTTEDEAGLLDTYYDLLVQRRDELASLGATEEAREAVANEIIRVDQEIKNVAAQNLVELQIGQSIEALGTTLYNALGSVAGASAEAAAAGMAAIVNGLAAGGNAAIAAANQLQALQVALMKQIAAIRSKMGQAAAAAARANQTADAAGQIDIDEYNAGDQQKLDNATASANALAQIQPIAATGLGSFGGSGGGIGAGGGGGGGGGGGNQETQADIDRARLAIARAQNEGNEAVLANIDLMEAAIDAREAEATPEKADDLQAIANRIKAERAIADQRKADAAKFRKAVALFQSATGDTVGAAEQELQIAMAEYRDAANRYGANSIYGLEARAELAQAMVAVRDATEDRKRNFVAVLLGRENLERDAIESANADLKLAQEALQNALGKDDKLKKELAVIQAQNAVEDAMADVRNSVYDLRSAELAAAEDSIAGAELATEQAREQLRRAKETGAGTAEINRARAQLITAEKQERQTRLDEARANYDFLYDMEEITRRQYIAYLEALLSGLQPGTDAFRELSRTIKQLKDDISGDLQTNIPDTLALPTLYEARRLNQTTSAGGVSGIGYQDNRNQDITIYVNNGMGEQEVVRVLGSALGVGSNGLETTAY